MDATDAESLRQWQAAQLDDDDEPAITPPLHALDAATATALLMLILSPDNHGNILWKAGFKRLAVLAHLLLPEAGAQSLEAIAQQLTHAGVKTSRASLSNINVQLYDATGLRRTEKSQTARESYRRRACEVWNRKPNRYKTKKPLIHKG